MTNVPFPYSIDYAKERNDEEIIRRKTVEPEKGDHKPGEKLYLFTPSSSYWVSMVRHPYTVKEVKGNTMKVQACELVFSGPRYYDMLPDEIREDPFGKIVTLRWSAAKKRWQESPVRISPTVAVFGAWDYQPYLD